MLPRFVAASLLLALPALASASTSIVHVWPAYRDTDSFRRISEYVGAGHENTGRETVLRTQADNRDGYYFLTRLKSDTAVTAATIVLELVLPGNPAVRTFRFPTDLPAGQQVFQLGVTGTDWPASTTRPAAWRVTARTADDKVIAEHSSFLWGAPTAAQ